MEGKTTQLNQILYRKRRDESWKVVRDLVGSKDFRIMKMEGGGKLKRKG